MKTGTKEIGEKLSTLLYGGISLAPAMVATESGSRNVVDTLRKGAEGAVEGASTVTNSTNITSVMGGATGWTILIIAAVALVAGLGIIYYLNRLQRSSPAPAWRDTRSKRVQLYNPPPPEDAMSPFSPRRGLG